MKGKTAKGAKKIVAGSKARQSQGGNLFLVSTPYHVRVALEIISSDYSAESNILISISSLSSEAIVSREHDHMKAPLQVVHACYSRSGEFPKSSTLVLLVNLLFSRCNLYLDKRVRLITGYNPKRIFVFSPNALTLLARSLYPNADLFLCEEGIGSYIGSILNRKFYLDNKTGDSSLISRLMRCINKLLFKGQLLLRPKGMLVHQPSLVTTDYSFPVLKIESLDHNDSVNHAASTAEPDDSEWQVIFLGQAVEDGDCSRIERDDKLFEAIAKRLPGMHYRKHPRDKREYKERNMNTTVDWEAFCAEVNADRTVLITDYSTAAVVPKLLSDKEPWLLFLFDCEHETVPPLSDDLREFFERFVSGYRQRYRVMIPRTEEELIDACAHIRLLIREGDRLCH